MSLFGFLKRDIIVSVKKTVLSAGFFILAAGFVSAAELPKVSAKAAPQRITLGQEFKLAVDAEKPAGFTLDPLSREVPLAPFEVKNVEHVSSGQNGASHEKFIFTLAVFEMGDLQVPSVALQFRDASGRLYQRFTDPVPVSVVGVKKRPTDKEDVRPIKPPFSSGALFIWTVVLSALAVLLAAALGLIVFLRKRKNNIDPETLKPPHERAALEWGRLKAKPVMKDGIQKEFYSELSSILKRYLDRRFQMDTFELTTQEVLQLAKQQELPPSVIQKMRHVLENSDLVKFAKYEPDRAFADALGEEIMQVVEDTKPIVEEKK